MAASDLQDGELRLGQLATPPPVQDEEEPEGATMTLVEHLEELRRRLFYSVLAIAICSVLGFVFWDKILGFLAAPLPNVLGRLLTDHGETQKLIETHIGGPFMVA
ncbi:MAG TPA: twin-arginine translocase subunit TatC, partial [Ktedonobacterales bacterium]|nr:twin-arginine translocase subunit TatC [Ktedonobacterales bacterium]